MGSESGTPASCPMKLRPSGQCVSSGAGAEEMDDCPYQLTLPPFTIQLPKQFKLLEKTMKELQNLKEVVNKLKSGCLECRVGRASGASGHQQADQGQPPVPVQKDGVEVAGSDATGQELQGVLSQKERADGMVPGAAVDGAGVGQGSATGKIMPRQSTMQEMQVRVRNPVSFKRSTFTLHLNLNCNLEVV